MLSHFLKFLSILIVAILSCGIHYNCQAADPLPLVYRLKANTLLQECDDKGAPGTMPQHAAPAYARFTLVNPQKNSDGFYIMQFAQWTPLNGLPEDLRTTDSGVTLTKNGVPAAASPADKHAFDTSYYFDLNYNAYTGAERYFRISSEQLDTSAEPLAAAATPIVGAMVMPFKFRPQTGDFTKDVTLSGMGGASFSLNRSIHHSLGVLVGLGITSATLTPNNSKLTETQDRSAITLSFGTLYQWDRLQVGLLLGTDILGEGNASWRYNKKVWYAAGIGFNIFNPEEAKAKSTGKNAQ
jgi:hypothetical protein